MRTLWLAVILNLLSLPSWAAIAIVQHNGAGSAVNSTDVAVTVSATTANLLVVAAVRNGSTDSVSSVSDNMGNTYSQASSARGTSSSITSDIWYCANAVPGVTTVTVHWGATSITAKFGEVWEVSGFQAAVQDGGNHSGSSGVANVITGASITTTSTNGFAAAIVINGNSAIDQNPNGGNEFSSGGDILTTGSNNVGAVSLLSSTAVAHNAAWHATTATPNETNSIAAFKEGTPQIRRALTF